MGMLLSMLSGSHCLWLQPLWKAFDTCTAGTACWSTCFGLAICDLWPPYLNVRDLFSVAFSCSPLNWSQLTPIHKTYKWSIVHDSLPPLIGVPSPAKRYKWPAPAQIFARSPCLAKALAVTRFNCLWQLTGVIYHIGQEGRLFEYELYIDCIKMIHMQKGFWNLTAFSSCIHVHRFVPAWGTPLHRRIDGDWSCNVAEKRRHWAYFTILFWQFAEEKCDK